jgi:hypothetical protein
MVANGSFVGIDLNARIEHIDSDLFEEPEAGVAAIPGFADYLQDRVYYGAANIRDPAFP